MGAGATGPTARRRGRASLRARLLPGDGPLARVPAVVVFAVVAGIFAAGVIVGGAVGALLLLVLAAGVTVLLATTWSRLSSGERAGRVVVLGILLAVAVTSALGLGR